MPHNDNGQHFPGVWRLVKRCDQNLKEALVLADQLIRLADQGDQDREDTGCGILYGMVRDAGYKIRQVAEDEKKKAYCQRLVGSSTIVGQHQYESIS